MNVTPQSILSVCEATLQEDHLVNGFTLIDQKVHRIHVKEKSTSYFPICNPFEAMGRTFDDEGNNSGIVVRFAADRKSREIVECTVSLSDLVSSPARVVARLADKGLWVAANKEAVGKISELLSLIQPANDIVTVNRPGWYGQVFVSPTGQVVGSDGNEYRLAKGAQYENAEPSGDLAGWRTATSAALHCPNGDFLCMGLLSGFAGTVVNLMQEPTSVLLNFAGTTSRGKTTAQRLGASVWGNPVRGAALVKFNATANSIESIAEKANGSLLAIDEGGQSGMSGPQYQTAVFNLAEGSGKRRLTASATERQVRRWSTCATISEEIGFADKVRRDGRNPAAGAVARIWEIDVDDAVILDGVMVSKIDAISQHYGHAAPLFVQHLFDAGYVNNVDPLRKRVADANDSLSKRGDAPQKRRVSGAAAILLVAGELAQEAGLIDQDYDVEGAIRRVLERSFLRMARNMDPVEAALTKLREDIPGRVGLDVLELDYEPDSVRREIVAFFGHANGPDTFVTEQPNFNPDERIYFIPVERLQELGGGNTAASTIARAMNKDGFLIKPNKKNSVFPTMPRGQKIKHYRIRGSFFHDCSSFGIAAE